MRVTFSQPHSFFIPTNGDTFPPNNTPNILTFGDGFILSYPITLHRQKEVSDEMQIWDYRDSLFIGLSIYRATDSSAKSNTISPAREYKRRQDERITGIRNRIIKE